MTGLPTCYKIEVKRIDSSEKSVTVSESTVQKTTYSILDISR